MSMQQFQEIRIAVPRLPKEAAPLTSGLESAPGVHFEQMELSAVVARFLRDECDCALLPPLAAAENTAARIVPGIGLAVVRCGAAALCCREELRAPCRIALEPAAEIFEGPVRLLAAMRFGVDPRALAIETARADAADAVLTVQKPPEPRDCPVRYDIHELWAGQSGFPLVALLWACRRRAPHARVRQLVAAARQRGLAQLETASSGPCRYDLGSEAVDGLGQLLQCAGEYGLRSSTAGIAFC